MYNVTNELKSVAKGYGTFVPFAWERIGHGNWFPSWNYSAQTVL
jgi:hypothetical protein